MFFVILSSLKVLSINVKLIFAGKSSNKLPYAKTKMLKHLESYHSPFGIDKIMRRKNEEIRIGGTRKQPSCIFIQNGKKCCETAVVCTKYCIKHILFHNVFFICMYFMNV